MDPHTWPCKSRTTSTNIHSASMWGNGMLSRRPAWGDERLGGVAREGQGYPCYLHDMMMMMMMMMMMIFIYICMYISISTYVFVYVRCPGDWGCRIHRLHLCRGVRLPPPLAYECPDMTLSNLMVRFQWCWDFGEYGAPLHCHCSQLQFGTEW